ncbi:hypothetical protein VM1G_06202 [Cytospora mali]|uniref:Small ribosomal subunit protein mS38 n=1 Tax=Cytospora mali TaxID=578113 RepID=A0A194W382_CYTMA|nr:hypothetical protein VM1G_06202 [Valsa mali]
MLPSSVRRVAAAAPQSPILSTLGSTLPRAGLTHAAFSYKPFQNRRYSSSKPSRDNDSGNLPVRQSVQQSTVTNKAGEAKSSGDKRKRKAKENGPEKQKLPSVPSTHNIPKDSLALSSFFSLHRPISVTHSLPRIVTDDAFAAIFRQRTRAQKSSEVMSTLSRTVEELEQPMNSLSIQEEADSLHHADHGTHKIDLRNPEGSDATVTVQVNAMSGQFLPFRPPPLPQPQAAGAAEPEAMAAEEDQQPHTRVYKAVFTIEETTDSRGEVSIMAHSPELMEDPRSSTDAEPRTFLERMAIRQQRYDETRSQRDRMVGNGMLAISVKRQRKLKMKKKKYKKLMKKLRHERRKHDR